MIVLILLNILDTDSLENANTFIVNLTVQETVFSRRRNKLMFYQTY